MRIFSQDITFIEVPGEVSLTFGVSGCTNNCPGCSWATLDTEGDELTEDAYRKILGYHEGLATCVTFLGGEWTPEIESYLMIASEYGFKTCLYTGLDDVAYVDHLVPLLNYLKVGKYREELGGLDSEKTNQTFTNLDTGEDITHLFIKSTSKEEANEAQN